MILLGPCLLRASGAGQGPSGVLLSPGLRSRVRRFESCRGHSPRISRSQSLTRANAEVRERESVSLTPALCHCCALGGFNWSLQHLDLGGVRRGHGGLEFEDQRCAGGATSAVASQIRTPVEELTDDRRDNPSRTRNDSRVHVSRCLRSPDGKPDTEEEYASPKRREKLAGEETPTSLSQSVCVVLDHQLSQAEAAPHSGCFGTKRSSR